MMKKYIICASILFHIINLQEQEKEAFISIDPTGTVFPWSHLDLRNSWEVEPWSSLINKCGIY